ncbi:protein kinase [Rhodoblastus sp. 17X3]|uniref:bifunctional protein-serine/threonine kinase/phosphatase n=1 Tax=Rhodoblastus sp. 17X3 TaxID=3047026 RepID=UPI0024B6F19B|nr:bifunctional protein-serine/threonine kinase/phosphatase [Rhodoblastus sp. 17X3]MDI9850130.1 protein kinase [Rhodoblastus sp. 17X3]
MTSDAPPAVAAGWSLAYRTACAGDGEAPEFHAFCRGEDFGAPRRGALAVLTRGDISGLAAGEAAQIAGRLFAEGYFGALGTLGPARAAARALSSANAWMFQQARSDPQRRGMAASLCAILFPAGKKLLALNLGDNRIYLRRGGQTQLLTRDHLRPLASGGEALVRALGLDEEAQADVVEIEAQASDRLVLVSAGLWRAMTPERLETLLAGDLSDAALTRARAAGAALALDVLAAPSSALEDIAAEFARLPIRPPPHEGDMRDGFLIGRTIYRGRYTLLKRARDTLENRDVVLKLPLPAMGQDPVFQAGFLREAWIGARTRSRWTVDYLDLRAERRSSLYLVMPYYRGATLEDRLKTSPPVSIAEGVGIGISLCDAIEDLAKKQIVHRDIKPENVFLLETGEIKLLDLGLAALPGLDDSEADALGGTTRYMAPELFRGAAAGQGSEVFSLGVTLYRLFSGGDFPFGRREAFPLARARRDLPPWLGRALAKAIESDPSARFADAAAFRLALEHGLTHEEWRGPPQRRFGDSVNVWRALAALLALACLALAFGRR